MIAAIDVDPQNGFTPLCPNELPIPDGQSIVSELNTQAQFAHFRILTKDAHAPNAIWLASDSQPSLTPLAYSNSDLAWPMHCEIGTFGFQHLQGLPDITKYDYVVWKGIEPTLHPYGACYHDLTEKLSTGLIEWLQSKQVTCVLIGGLATEHCVKKTALQLKKSNFDVWVNLNACRGLNKKSILFACQEMTVEGIHCINDLDLFYSAILDR